MKMTQEATAQEATEQKRAHLIKRLYLAKKAIFPQLEGVIDVLHNLSTTVESISNRYEINSEYLKEWVAREISMSTDTDYDEDEEDSEDE